MTWTAKSPGHLISTRWRPLLFLDNRGPFGRPEVFASPDYPFGPISSCHTLPLAEVNNVVSLLLREYREAPALGEGPELLRGRVVHWVPHDVGAVLDQHCGS